MNSFQFLKEIIALRLIIDIFLIFLFRYILVSMTKYEAIFLKLLQQCSCSRILLSTFLKCSWKSSFKLRGSPWCCCVTVAFRLLLLDSKGSWADLCKLHKKITSKDYFTRIGVTNHIKTRLEMLNCLFCLNHLLCMQLKDYNISSAK